MTFPEVLLWQELRRRPGGPKFRRQHPAGEFILDFYCASANLAIEVDGEIHSDHEQIAHDRGRDAWLNSQCVRVLRVPAREILNNLTNVIDGIVASILLDQPLHRPSDGPPPRSGEE